MVFSTSVIILEVSNNQKERGIRESNRGRVMEDVQEPRGREAGERWMALRLGKKAIASMQKAVASLQKLCYFRGCKKTLNAQFVQSRYHYTSYTHVSCILGVS